MSEMLTIAGSRVEADARSASYRRLYATILVIQAIIAAVAFVYPEWACRLLGIPLAASAVPWPRLAATFLLALVAFQVPGYLDPIYNRSLNVLGILSRCSTALVLVLLGGGFYWLAAFDLVCAILLFLSYQSLIKAEVMTRP